LSEGRYAKHGGEAADTHKKKVVRGVREVEKMTCISVNGADHDDTETEHWSRDNSLVFYTGGGEFISQPGHQLT
jgi:hypothetical protein